MPLIKCLAPYRTQFVEWTAGKEEMVSDEEAEFLLRDSPGSFELVSARKGSDSPSSPDVDLSAMSSKTETGLVVPDRRARGGQRR